MTVGAFLKETIDLFAARFQEESRLEATWLMVEILGVDRSYLLSNREESLTADKLAKLEEARQRRNSGEPLAYILGRKDFYGRTFFVGPGVLIPRPETELIVQLALKSEFQSVVDFGAGSGCIGLTLLCENAAAQLWAIEKSAAAVSYLKKNINALGCGPRAHVVVGAVEDVTLPSQADLVTANPPYIDASDTEVMSEVRAFEPHEALFAADAGLALIMSWSQAAAKSLKPGGRLLMEMGARQKQAVLKMPWRQWGFEMPLIHADLAGWPRVIDTRKV